MKKLLTTVLAVVMLLSVIPMNTFAATYSGTCGDNLTWTLDLITGEFLVEGFGEMSDYDYWSDIDYGYDYRPWKEYKNSIKTVIIGDGVTTIGENSFIDCNSLADVTIADSVAMIGYSAFYDCDSLTRVTIGDSVITIGDSAFSDCDSLTSVTIGDSVITIGNSAFSNCDNLASVTIGNSVTTIGNSAFSSCDSLTSLTIPNSVKSIGNFVFGIPLGSHPIEIYYDGTKEEWDLISFGIYPPNNDSIHYNPERFNYCGDNLTWTFDKETGALEITGTGDMDNFSFDNRPWEGYISSIKSVVISDTVVTIGNYAFSDCDNLVNLTIGNSVSLIGYGSFRNCDRLTNVTFPDSVVKIDNGAFSECNSLTSVTIGSGIATIGLMAFDSIISLTDVYYSGSEEEWNVISIGEDNEPLFNATIHFNYTHEPEITYSTGDINGDGSINSTDALYILQYAVGMIELSETAFAAADVHNDGRVNSTDALKILQYAVGIIDQL